MDVLTDAPAEVFSAGRRLYVGTASGDPDPDAATLTVERARPRPDGKLIVHFLTVPDRTEAERWRGRYLLAPRDELRPLAPGEVYLHELSGMQVLLPSGETLGDVQGVYELPQGIAFEVRHDGRDVVIPLQEGFVQQMDRATRRITVTLPPGFLD